MKVFSYVVYEVLMGMIGEEIEKKHISYQILGFLSNNKHGSTEYQERCHCVEDF